MVIYEDEYSLRYRQAHPALGGDTPVSAPTTAAAKPGLWASPRCKRPKASQLLALT